TTRAPAPSSCASSAGPRSAGRPYTWSWHRARHSGAMPETLDFLVVGAGPAGLVAATYLARYRSRVAVADPAAGGARWIPTSHTCPGFPLGVSGTTLLARLREQAEANGVVVARGRIEALARVEGGDGGPVFLARDAEGKAWRA